MSFLRAAGLALLLLPQASSPIEIGPRCACAAAEIQAATRSGFNRVFAVDVPATIRIGSVREARLQLWKAVARGERRIVLDDGGALTRDVLSLGEAAGVITRNEALFAPLKRRTANDVIRAEPATEAIVGHVLESPDAIVLIVLNESPTTRRVKLLFPPDLPEAIWQNMEAGNAVNFVMGASGAHYEHTFSPHDALVLAIRKKLR